MATSGAMVTSVSGGMAFGTPNVELKSAPLNENTNSKDPMLYKISSPQTAKDFSKVIITFKVPLLGIGQKIYNDTSPVLRLAF